MAGREGEASIEASDAGRIVDLRRAIHAASDRDVRRRDVRRRDVRRRDVRRRDMRTDLHVVRAHFPWMNGLAASSVAKRHPAIHGSETVVELAVQRGEKRDAQGVAGRIGLEPAISHALDLDVGERLRLHGPAARIIGPVAPHGGFDPRCGGVVAFDTVGVVAVGDAEEIGDAGADVRMQLRAQRRSLALEGQGEIGQAWRGGVGQERFEVCGAHGGNLRVSFY